jgi:hypothetical protein
MWQVTEPSEDGTEVLSECTTYYRDGGLFIISKYINKFRSFIYIDRDYKESIIDEDMEVLKLKSLLCLKKHGFKITSADFKEIIK